jgi:predicted hotdog family 3-hydroxylacyl-ACP dehydratase
MMDAIREKKFLQPIADKALIAQRIPHQIPMLLIDSLLKTEKENSVLETTITAEHLFLKEGGLTEETLFPELIAQGAAVHDAWQNPGVKKKVFLTALENICINRPAKIGETLTIKIQSLSQLENLHWIQGFVFSQEEELASGRVGVWKQ